MINNYKQRRLLPPLLSLYYRHRPNSFPKRLILLEEQEEAPHALSFLTGSAFAAGLASTTLAGAAEQEPLEQDPALLKIPSTASKPNAILAATTN
jgi:hypothetical protein